MEGEIVEVDMSRSMERGEVEEIENNTLVEEAEIEEVEGEIEVVEAGREEVEDRCTEAGIEEAGDDSLDVQQQLLAAPPLRMILPEPFSLMEGEIVEVDESKSMESGEVEDIENSTLVEAEIEEAEGEIETVVEAGRDEVEDRGMEAGIEEAGDHHDPLIDIQQQLPAAPPLRMILLVAAIALGIQFVSALNLSHLAPYVQLIGIPRNLAPFIWLLGPISSLLVQPVVGYYSDNCRSRFGRRSPFIATGAALVAVSVFIIGYAIDLGDTAGDSSRKGPKPKAIDIFVVGFCMLNVANNILQGPCRALLADLSGGNAQRMSVANSMFSLFMAVGNFLGYAAGSYTHLYRIFPFSKTEACDVYCANLKSCFFISVVLILTITAVALTIVRETPMNGRRETESVTKVFGELFSAVMHLSRPMWILLLVTCLNWIALFPFLQYNTDWMGKEVYGGRVGKEMYNRGIHTGLVGLMLNSVFLGVASLGLQYMVRSLGGAKRLWGIANLVLAVCLALMGLLTKLAEHNRRYMYNSATGLYVLQVPETGIKACALTLFSTLGIPLAVTFSVPFSLASIFSSNSGAGQGLSLGVLNLAIAIPQMIVSLKSGPLNTLFGEGYLPIFLVGAVAAATSGLLAFTMLPSPPTDVTSPL